MALQSRLEELLDIGELADALLQYRILPGGPLAEAKPNIDKL